MLHGTALLGAPTTTAVRDQVPCVQQAWERVIERNETALPARAPEGRRASYLSTTCGFHALKWENLVGARA